MGLLGQIEQGDPVGLARARNRRHSAPSFAGLRGKHRFLAKLSIEIDLVALHSHQHTEIGIEISLMRGSRVAGPADCYNVI